MRPTDCVLTTPRPVGCILTTSRPGLGWAWQEMRHLLTGHGGSEAAAQRPSSGKGMAYGPRDGKTMDCGPGGGETLTWKPRDSESMACRPRSSIHCWHPLLGD